MILFGNLIFIFHLIRNFYANSANSKYFCPWCEISKDERGNLNTNWKMNKTMEQLNSDYTAYKGHQQVPLFNMIPLDHWIVDELHIILRITDHL